MKKFAPFILIFFLGAAVGAGGTFLAKRPAQESRSASRTAAGNGYAGGPSGFPPYPGGPRGPYRPGPGYSGPTGYPPGGPAGQAGAVEVQAEGTIERVLYLKPQKNVVFRIEKILGVKRLGATSGTGTPETAFVKATQRLRVTIGDGIREKIKRARYIARLRIPAGSTGYPATALSLKLIKD